MKKWLNHKKKICGEIFSELGNWLHKGERKISTAKEAHVLIPHCDYPSLIFFLLFFLHFPGANLLAEEQSKNPVTIEADRISYDQDKDSYYANGNVFISFAGGTLAAESVILDKKTNNASADGHVQVKSDNDILEGEKVIFDIAAKTGVVYNGKIFIEKNHFYLKGEKIEKRGESNYNIMKASATTCDGDSPDWQLTGSELDVTIDGYGSLKHGCFLARNTPIFYLPYLPFPAKTTRQTGLLLPYLAYSRDKHGWDIEVPFYWAISKGADTTFYQRYMDKRGFKEGVEFRYVIGEDSVGTFYGDFIKDTKHIIDEAGGIRRNWQSDRNRWSYYLNHETRFDPTFYVRADISRVSDSWYFKDFSSHNYYIDHYAGNEDQSFKKVPFYGNESLASLTSTVRLFKGWDLYSLTALGRYIDDLREESNDSTIQTYPEITLTGIKQPIHGTPLNVEFDASYDHYYEKEKEKGNLFDIQPTISCPLNLGGYLQLMPEVGWKGTFWQEKDNQMGTDDGHADRQLFKAGLGMATEFYKVFDIGGTVLDKIRHSVKPEVTYTYIPYSYKGSHPDFLAVIDERNDLTYALINTFTVKLKEKDGKSSYREFLRIKLSQNYDIEESGREVIYPERDREPFSEIDMEVDLKAFPYFYLSARNRLNVNSGDWSRSNYDVALHDGRGDSAALGYRYTQNFVKEIDLTLKAMILNSLDAIYIFRRNELDQKTMERTYSLNYHRQCWALTLSYSESDNDRRYMFNFSLLGLGKAGR